MNEPTQSTERPIRLLSTLRGHNDWISRPAWSPEGRWLATPSNDLSIGLWEVATETLLAKLSVDAPGFDHTPVPGSELRALTHGPRFHDAQFSPDGELLATASADLKVRLWEPGEGAVRAVLRGHRGKVLSVSFSPDGSLLASGSEDQTVRLWRVADGELVRELVMPESGESAFVFSVAFSPSGTRLATATYDGRPRVWEVATGELVRELGPHGGAVYDVAWAPTGEALVSASSDRTMAVWNTDTWERVTTLDDHRHEVYRLAVAPGAPILASKSRDGSVRLWRCDAWICIAELEERSSGWWASGLAFSPRAPLLATLGNEDHAVRIWQFDPLALLVGDVADRSRRDLEAKGRRAFELNVEAIGERNQGRVLEAIELFEKALALRAKMEDFVNIGTNHRNICQAWLMLGHLPEAALAANRAIEAADLIFDSAGALLASDPEIYDHEREALAFSHGFHAIVAAMMGDATRAEEGFRESAASNEVEEPTTIHGCWYAMWLGRCGEIGRGYDVLEATGIADGESLHEKVLYHIARAFVGRHALVAGSTPRSSSLAISTDAHTAVTLARELGYHWYLARALLEAGRCEAILAGLSSGGGHGGRAARLLDEVEPMAEGSSYRLLQADLQVVRAVLAQAAGRRRRAKKHAKRALSISTDKTCAYAWGQQDAERLL